MMDDGEGNGSAWACFLLIALAGWTALMILTVIGLCWLVEVI